MDDVHDFDKILHPCAARLGAKRWEQIRRRADGSRSNKGRTKIGHKKTPVTQPEFSWIKKHTQVSVRTPKQALLLHQL
jgi:hypothetical protein